MLQNSINNLCNRIFKLLVIFYFLLSSHAIAHERIGSVSYSIITVQGQTVNYYLNIPPALASLLDGDAREDKDFFKDYFAFTLRVTTWDTPCALSQIDQMAQQGTGNRVIHLVYQCPKEVKDLTITSASFYDLDEKHVQFAKLAPADNPRHVIQEAALTEKDFVFHISDVKTGGSAFAYRAYKFFAFGVDHILSGYDHILFLMSSILLTVRFMQTLKVVTSFTVAHSITLALAFFGVISLPATIVEPAVALTIVYVAFENMLIKNSSKRWMVTFFFGLVHGLGFVGALKEITVSRQELLTSLFSFNLGIEAGQLLIVSIAVPLLYFMRNHSLTPVFQRWFSFCIGIAGLFWFIERAFVVDLTEFLKRLA